MEDRKKLAKIWHTMQKKTFDEFMKNHLGVKNNPKPGCYGDGDGYIWCSGCPYVVGCIEAV